MKEIPLKMNRHKKIENWEFVFNFIYKIPLNIFETILTKFSKSPSILNKRSQFEPKKKITKKLKSLSNLYEKSFKNWSDLEKK